MVTPAPMVAYVPEWDYCVTRVVMWTHGTRKTMRSRRAATLARVPSPAGRHNPLPEKIGRAPFATGGGATFGI